MCFQDKDIIINYKTKNKSLKKTKLGKNYYLRSGTAIYKGSKIGNNFSTGHNAVVRENNVIGNNVVVGVNSYLGPGNKIGNNVRIHTGCFLEDVEIFDDVIISPGVVFTNDLHPACPAYKKCFLGAKVGKGSVIGANATILPGIKIGNNCLIGAGSVVVSDVSDNEVVVGNPAKVIKKRNDLRCFKNIYKKAYEWEK